MIFLIRPSMNQLISFSSNLIFKHHFQHYVMVILTNFSLNPFLSPECLIFILYHINSVSYQLFSDMLWFCLIFLQTRVTSGKTTKTNNARNLFYHKDVTGVLFKTACHTKWRNEGLRKRKGAPNCLLSALSTL